MKLDPELRLQILEKVGIYANRFSITEPEILLATKEVLNAPKEMTEEFQDRNQSSDTNFQEGQVNCNDLNLFSTST